METTTIPHPHGDEDQPAGHSPPFASASRRRAWGLKGVLAAVTATLVLAGAAGAGTGYALGLRHQVTDTTASSGASTLPGTGQDWPAPPSYSGGQGYGVPGSSGSAGQRSQDSTTTASADQLTGLVRIVSTQKYAGGKAVGTGMVLSSGGEVVTNHHVVAGATSVTATVMSTGRTYTARVVGTDTQDDIALLRLHDASGLETVTPSSSAVGAGDAVVAVGDANGSATVFNAASGTVSRLRTTITTQSEANVAGETLRKVIEISSDVVSGDSGGATYDAQGHVVGMTTAASSGMDVNGYAIPVDRVLRVADALAARDTAARYDYGRPAFLGVELAAGQRSPTVQAVLRGTPAGRAGLAAGDVVRSLGGTSISSADQLSTVIAGHRPGDQVGVTWTDTAGATHTATVRLTRGPVA